MGTWFWGFDATNTIDSIRKTMQNPEECRQRSEKLNELKYGTKSAYHALAAIILGTISPTDRAAKNYNDFAFNNEANENNNGSWNSPVKKVFGNEWNNYNTFVSNIKPTWDLSKLYQEIYNCNDIVNELKIQMLHHLNPNNSAGAANYPIQTGGGSANNEDDVNTIIADGIKRSKQVIFTGAPGTGKTWAVRKYVKEQAKGDESRYSFLQFHPSYDYTDFVEGLRPVPDVNGKNVFVRMDGTFKAFCREVVKKNLARLRDDTSLGVTSFDDYRKIMECKEESEGTEKNAEESEGTEKSFEEKIAKRNKIIEMLDKKRYFFVIDEINRADLSKVFGELMFGLEESYREVHNRFDTQYKNLPTYEMTEEGGKKFAKPIEDDFFKDGFFIPSNLYIIGTMNDIDRSVESFDFALRRRFLWIDIKAKEVMEKSLKSMREACNGHLSNDVLVGLLFGIKEMNNAISGAGLGLSEAYHIGPAYFKDVVKVADADADAELEKVFYNRIEPILREYTRGRKEEIVKDLVKKCKDALIGNEA